MEKLKDTIVQVESVMMTKSNDENEEHRKLLMKSNDKKEKPKTKLMLAVEIWAKFINPTIYISFSVIYFIYHCAI